MDMHNKNDTWKTSRYDKKQDDIQRQRGNTDTTAINQLNYVYHKKAIRHFIQHRKQFTTSLFKRR